MARPLQHIGAMSPCTTCGHPNPEWARFCGQCGARLGPEPTDPLVGRILAERYRVVRPIGAGAMGNVYLAEQQLGRTRRLVAVKVLTREVRGDAELIARFHRECAAMASLDHPNTVRIFDFGELEDGTPYLVMEHVDGEPLSAVVDRGPLALDRVQRIVAQIAGSLGQAHQRGIVHRDLKPDNVILVSDGPSEDFVKLLDFGIAKHVGEAQFRSAEITAPGTILGTPQYMAPEQFTGGEVDQRTDVYALGMMTYEMLTGHLPFEAETPLEWATEHMHHAPAPPAQGSGRAPIRPEVQQAVLQALSKDRQDRQATVLELAEQLAFPSTVPRETSVHIPAPPVKTSIRALGMSAVLVLLIGGGLVAWSALTDETTPEAGATSEIVAPPVDVDEDGAEEREEQAEEQGGHWLDSLHHVRNATDAQQALGPRDGRYATIRPAGMITLELGSGRALMGDGTSAADLTVHVDEERSGPFRLAAGLDHHHLHLLEEEARGVTRVDLDVSAPEGARYVRIWNRGGRNVYVDAVGGPRTAEATGTDRAKP